MEIRSYRRVFDLERRIYSIDTLRLNPTGVPMRGLAYFLVLICCAVLAARLPLAGWLVRAMPWYVSYLGAPLAGAGLLAMLRLDGRSFHHSARAVLRFWIGPRRVSALRRCGPGARRWVPEQIVLLPDGSDGRMRRLRYRGPGAVLVACEHERGGKLAELGTVGRARRASSRTLVLRPLAGSRPLANGKVIVLARGGCLLVRPPRRRPRKR
jgi:hypothetical protein